MVAQHLDRTFQGPHSQQLLRKTNPEHRPMWKELWGPSPQRWVPGGQNSLSLQVPPSVGGELLAEGQEGV
jgi:hypothetical protein